MWLAHLSSEAWKNKDFSFGRKKKNVYKIILIYFFMWFWELRNKMLIL